MHANRGTDDIRMLPSQPHRSLGRRQISPNVNDQLKSACLGSRNDGCSIVLEFRSAEVRV